MENKKKRVYCLYRVSTKGQVEKNDIPMQKECCRAFAQQNDWEIVREFSEKGVSGFKVSAKNRDAIIEIQQDAIKKKFDILLVFMFDRLGRKDDETPFVVEWFDHNGIEVWSTQEGRQRFDNHVDKLINYIRFWQASGESIKTGIRTKTRLDQIVKEGRWRGGTPPYGYKLVKKGKYNKKGHEVYDIAIEPGEAKVIKLIFEKYVNEGYGAQRLEKFLLQQRIFNRKGENFTNTTLIKMIQNPAYTGILRNGESKSEIFPDLQIIRPELFRQAQAIRKDRAMKHSDIPFNSKGKSLLPGKVYCGHCGSKLVLTTSGGRAVQEGERPEPRLRYQCHYKVRHPQSCDGQSGYEAKKLDSMVDETVRLLFARIKAVPAKSFISRQLEKQLGQNEERLKRVRKENTKASVELESYKSEVLKVIRGTSSFSRELLRELIEKSEKQVQETRTKIEEIEKTAADLAGAIARANEQYHQVLDWSELYDKSTTEAKKMILAQLIDRVTIKKGYQLDIAFSVSYEQFMEVCKTREKKAQIEQEQPTPKKKKNLEMVR
ncbi:recombinase family protein [Provencibacterium massiliense]|uniref:recombinase family protein n=1 Tax=Provencibacterium massiliense TaxID=1841868 RepID=UPI0009A79054|nr:recombinase family protein [Provencibacterium massiliense]RGB70026.1 recombinase family protein [Harryflintia acetispora]